MEMPYPLNLKAQKVRLIQNTQIYCLTTGVVAHLFGDTSILRYFSKTLNGIMLRIYQGLKIQLGTEEEL